METIGERLRRRREELGLSIEQAAEATKFRPELIEAVEEGRAGVFSAGVYRDGFIRTYAALLNLDGDTLLRDQKTEEERAHEAIRGLKIRPARSRISRRVLAGVLVLAAVVIVAAVLIGRAGKGDDDGKRQGGTLQSSESDSAAGGRGRARKMRHIAGAKAADSLASARVSVSEVPDTTRGDARTQADLPRERPQTAVGGQVAEPAERGQTVIGGREAKASERAETVISGQAGRQDTAASQVAGLTEHPQSMAGREVVARRGGAQPAVGGQAQGTERGEPERAGPGLTGPEPSGQAERTEPREVSQMPPVPKAASTETGAQMHTLEIVANRSSNFTVKSGERTILDDYWLRRGERVVRTDTGPFVIVTLSDWRGVSITLDGKPVRLPLSDSPELFDWPIPSDR